MQPFWHRRTRAARLQHLTPHPSITRRRNAPVVRNCGRPSCCSDALDGLRMQGSAGNTAGLRTEINCGPAPHCPSTGPRAGMRRDKPPDRKAKEWVREHGNRVCADLPLPVLHGEREREPPYAIPWIREGLPPERAVGGRALAKRSIPPPTQPTLRCGCAITLRIERAAASAISAIQYWNLREHRFQPRRHSGAKTSERYIRGSNSQLQRTPQTSTHYKNERGRTAAYANGSASIS